MKPSGSQAPGQILVLDDEATFAGMLRDLLLSGGFTVEICTRPLEALESLKTHRFDLLVADYKMPQLDGAELVNRARNVCPGLPVIMISGLMNTPDLVKVANLGVTMVLEKPIQGKDFLQAVRRLVRPVHAPGAPSAAASQAFAATYPRPLLCLPDGNALQQRLIERFWQASGRFRHIFLSLPSGMDVTAYASQWQAWLGVGDGQPLALAAGDLLLDRAEALFQQHGVDGKPRVVVVLIQDQEDLTSVYRFLTLPKKPKPVGQNLRFLYQMPLAIARFPAEWSDQPEVFGEVLQVPRLAWMPDEILREMDALAGEPPLAFTEAAADALLHHAWPNNLAQLRKVVARLKASDQRPIDRNLVIETLRGVLRQPDDPPKGLRPVLERLQAELLSDALRKQGSPDKALRSLRVGLDRTVSRDFATPQPLIFPEILRDG